MAIPGLSRWQPRHLLGAWSAWWAGLSAATLAPAARAIWHVTHLPDGKGSASLSYEEGIFTFVTNAGDAATYTGTASLLAIGLWVAGPPLLLWVAWLATRRREDRAAAEVAAPALAERPLVALPPPDPLDTRLQRDLDAKAHGVAREGELRQGDRA